MEMMDLYGDALRPQELLKSLRRHAQGFTRPFKPLVRHTAHLKGGLHRNFRVHQSLLPLPACQTGPAEPDAERLLWALGLYR